MKTPNLVADIKVGSKTIEDIKKWLVCCAIAHTDECNADCENCEYDVGYKESIVMGGKTLAYIQQLESRLAQVERERDALFCEARGCYSCKHQECEPEDPPCTQCAKDGSGYEWRGFLEENAKEEEK